ncbi:MAG TPA: site-specific integrase [Roseomonas sp.]|nr:site-specific integrase [Roseomonas sp.]
MTVYRRETKQGVRFVVDFLVGGHRVNHTLRGVASMREAKAAEARLKEEYRARLNSSGSIVKMTLETALQRYVAERLKPKVRNPSSLATYLTYLWMIRDFFGPGRDVQTINNAAVVDWWSALVGGSGNSSRKPVKPNTAKRYLGQLKAVLAFAQEAGAGNTVPSFSPQVADDSRVRWLTDKEEDDLLGASPGWLRDFIVFSVETGARKQEALGVRWRDVDLEMQPRPVVRLYQTKGGKPRGVPLSLRAQKLLQRLRRSRPDASPDDKVLLWQERLGRALVPLGDFKKTWAVVAKNAKVEDVRPHDLRHTFASRLVLRRVPLYDVSKLLGHSSLKMTMRYAHLAPESLNNAIAALDEGHKPRSSRAPTRSGSALLRRSPRGAKGDAEEEVALEGAEGPRG